jgi:hypothetical protein
VGPRSDLDLVVKRLIIAPAGNRMSFVQPVADHHSSSRNYEYYYLNGQIMSRWCPETGKIPTQIFGIRKSISFLENRQLYYKV